jgi:DNA-binding beta-propeller fold protein YncE
MRLPSGDDVSRLARIVYVSNGRGDTVTPIAAATGTPGPPIPVGPAPGEIVVTPDGKTAYITTDDPVVVPIATATGTPGPPIVVDHGFVARRARARSPHRLPDWPLSR